MKNRIEYKDFYIDKTENGFRICRKAYPSLES